MPAHVYVGLMQQRNPSLANKSKTALQENYFSKHDEYAGHGSKAQCVPKLLSHPASRMALPIFSFWYWEWSLLPYILRIMPKYCLGSVLLQAKPTHTHKQARARTNSPGSQCLSKYMHWSQVDYRYRYLVLALGFRDGGLSNTKDNLVLLSCQHSNPDTRLIIGFSGTK